MLSTLDQPLHAIELIDQECWRAVVGFEGLYEVSNLGSVRSLRRLASNGRTVPARMIKLWNRYPGYKRAGLYRDGVQQFQYVHRLILEAFNGPCPEGMEACHNDGNAANNTLSNLRWDTRRANADDRVLHQGLKGLQQRCKNSHEFTEANTIHGKIKDGGATRRCRTCFNEYRRRRYGVRSANTLRITLAAVAAIVGLSMVGVPAAQASPGCASYIKVCARPDAPATGGGGARPFYSAERDPITHQPTGIRKCRSGCDHVAHGDLTLGD